MKKHLLPFLGKLLFLSFVILATFSCQKDTLETSTKDNEVSGNFKLTANKDEFYLPQMCGDRASFDLSSLPSAELEMEDMMELGPKLKNEFSFSIMREALQNLKLKYGRDPDYGFDEVIIHTNSYYIKYKPKNDEELAKLRANRNHVLWDYPLDHEEPLKGSFYHDPEVPFGQPTYQYAMVTSDYEFMQEIDYEILEELYDPEIDSELTQKTSESLMYEALSLVGYFDDENETHSNNDYWVPSGRIRVWDTNVEKWFPLKNIEIRLKRSFKPTLVTFTDENGYYESGESIKYSRKHYIYYTDGPINFTINKALWGVAKGRDWQDKRKSFWEVDIKEGKNMSYATAYRGAYRMYNENIDGMPRPWQPRSGYHMKLRVFHSFATYLGFYDPLTQSIYLHITKENFGDNYTYTEKSFASTSVLVQTACHELGHAIHDMILGEYGNYGIAFTSKIYRETFAAGIHEVAVRQEYKNELDQNQVKFTDLVSDIDINPEYWGIGLLPIFRDLNDDDHGGGMDNVVVNPDTYDLVKDYTPEQIIEASHYCNTWEKWRDKLSEVDNPTSNKVSTLFNYWRNVYEENK